MSNSIFLKDGTAQGVAKQRLIETLARSNERIINDPYAETFVKGAGIVKLMGHKLNVWLTQKLIPGFHEHIICLLYTSPSPRDGLLSRMPSSA